MRTAHKAPTRRRLPRAEWLAALTTLLFFAGLAWLAVQVVALHGELQTANGARDALAQQVQQLGAKPIAGPPGSRGEAGKTVVGPRGKQGQQGKQGENGSPAPTITPRPGESGKPGKDGRPGKDSTELGPSGAAGQPGQDATGVPGQPGRDGKDGRDGADGRDGHDGQTCPDGYSLQPPADDPDALVCRRNGAPDPTPKPTPSSSPPAVLAPERRRS